MTSKYSNQHVFISFIILMISTSFVYAEDFEATLLWSKRVELSTPVSGVVQDVYAEAGKVVAKGETLIQLDPRRFKANLKFAKAKYKHAYEQSLEAKRELDRQLDMYDRSMLSEHDLQTAKNNFTSAQSSYIQAQADLTKANLNLEYSAIRAPFNAVIISSKAIKGQVVASTITPPILVVVAEAKRMQAQFYTTADKLHNIIVNQGCTISVTGKNYQGKVLNVALESSQLKAGYYAVNVVFDTKDKILRAGQKVVVKL